LEAIHKKPCAQRKSRSSPKLPCERRTDPAQPPTASHPIARTKAQTPTENPETSTAHPYPKAESLTPLPHNTPSRRPRDRAGASIGSDPQKTLRAAQKPILPRAYLRAQDRSRRAPPNGIPPHRQNQSADPHREPRNLSAHPYPKAESLTLLPHNTPSRRPRNRAEASIGSDPQKTLRAAQKPILPRAYLRAQDRSRRAPPNGPPLNPPPEATPPH